jgi:RNA polymerase primary sigma factor
MEITKERQFNDIKDKDRNKKASVILKKVKIDDNDTIKVYLEEISKYPLLTFEEEKELSKKIQEDNDEYSLNKLINSNLRLVVKISKNYIATGYPLIDIIQDGNMGLIKAASKYDFKKNVRFSTYASWWIKQTIIRNLSVKNRMIRLSHRKEEKLRKIKKAKNKFYQKNKEMPSTLELSNILNISEKEIKEIISYSNSILSIEDNINDEENYTLKNIIEDNSFIPDNMIENKVLVKETEKIMNSLVPRERVIIAFRYGFNDKNKKYTLKKMGEMFGISAETVRQIELKALAKIRNQFPHLKDFLN